MLCLVGYLASLAGVGLPYVWFAWWCLLYAGVGLVADWLMIAFSVTIAIATGSCLCVILLPVLLVVYVYVYLFVLCLLSIWVVWLW